MMMMPMMLTHADDHGGDGDEGDDYNGPVDVFSECENKKVV